MADLVESLSILEPERFIRMVKEHPCLHDIRDPSYSLRTVRRRAWDQIASQIYTNWTEMSDKEKRVKLIKDKWKHFRDAYARYVRLVRSNRSGSAACPNKEYIHAKELEFLRPSLGLARTENSWEEAAPTSPVEIDTTSRISGDLTLEGLEPESQLASCSLECTPASQSMPATPIAELETTPRPVPRVAARGTRRKAPDQDPNVAMMVQIMSDLKERMNTSTNLPSYGTKSSQCIADLMDRVPKSLQAVMMAGTIRYINTFIPPEEPHEPTEPPPYGPYVNHQPQHLSAPPLRHLPAPPFPSHLPQHVPPYPTETPTHSTHPQLPTTPSAYTSSDLTHPQTQTSNHSPYRHPQTTTFAYQPPTLQTFHRPSQPPTYPSRTTYPSDYTHLPIIPPYNPQPTPTPPPPPPRPPATPPSRWPHATTSATEWTSLSQALHVGMSVDDPGESPSFQKL